MKIIFKQIPVQFKLYADFECNLENVESYEGSYSKKYQDHIPFSFPYKLVCVENEFTNQIVVFSSKDATYEFIKAIFKEYQYCKKSNEKTFQQKFDHEWRRRKKSNFNPVIRVGYVKNSLKMTMKKLEITVT